MQFPKDKADEYLLSCVKNYKIFIDTCSLLDESADAFWQHVCPFLQLENKAIIVPLRVYEEVKKFAEDMNKCLQKGDPSLNTRARNAMNNIGRLQRSGLVEVFGDKNDNFADNVFLSVFTTFRLKFNMMLITQDNKLKEDLVAIGKSQSVKSKYKILVKRLNKHGYLSVFRNENRVLGSNNNEAATQVASGRTPISDDECFPHVTTIRTVSGKLSVKDIPSEGAVLTAERDGEKKEIILRNIEGGGGEGSIYNTNVDGIVAKIYNADKLDRLKYEKLRLMMTKSIDYEGICFPIALLYNKRSEFVGYLMKKARGVELLKSVFVPKLMQKKFPKWTKIDTVTLCITILKKLKYLHDRNIILGDINPANILVVSPTEVYFVDTDSYQVAGYPCTVCWTNFVAPEIQKKDFSKQLRSIGNERFAVATLLFMIMLPGKAPYAHQGGEEQGANIIKGDFPYPSGSRSTGKAPEGMWRFCWSHLPRYLKDAFYESFHKDGMYSKENNRYSTGDWINMFERYLDLLASGKMAEQDPMSIQILPTRLKKNPNVTYIRCRICGNEVDEDRTEQGICQSCLNKGEVYRCAKCGREMLYTNYQKLIKRVDRYEICKDCYDHQHEVYTTIRCADCGRSFDISYGEKEFYEEKGFVLPKKCKKCRGHKSQTNINNGRRPLRSSGSGSSNHGSYDPYNKGKSGWCFITTAACEYFGKSDDCYELTMLRMFRDGWLLEQPEGKELVKEYYRIAPAIVSQLDNSDKRGDIYNEIWIKYIIPCVRLIEQNAYIPCCNLYKQMVQKLETLLRGE